MGDTLLKYRKQLLGEVDMVTHAILEDIAFLVSSPNQGHVAF